MKTHLLAAVVSAALLPAMTAHAQPGHPDTDQAVAPRVAPGVTIVELDQHPVPDVLKAQARSELAQMKRQGHVDAPDDRVLYLERAKADTQHLKPWSEVKAKVKLQPASLAGSPLGRSTLIGATAGITPAGEGATEVFRLFSVAQLGLVGLEEVDLAATGGGWAMIKEAINQDVNGRPAILTTYRGAGGKHLTTLSWAAGDKMYTLSVDQAVGSGRKLQDFLDVARSIVD